MLKLYKWRTGAANPYRVYCIIRIATISMQAIGYWQYFAIMGMVQSMGRKGNYWDNAPTERFFHSLKYERLKYEKFRTKAAAKSSVIDYLTFYNDHRSHSAIDYMTPIEFEWDFFNNAA